MTGPTVVGSIPPAPAADAATAKAPNDKPSKALPTDRVGYQKQWELLRAYAAITQQGKKVITNPEVSELVKIHPNTAILAHPFLIENGLLKKDGNGYVVAPEVVAYGKAFNWNADTAPQKLAPLLRGAWFANALLPRLAMGPVQERAAIEVLADASSAGPRFEGQLKTVLAYMVTVGLVRKDGDTYRQALPITEDAPVRSEAAAVVEEEQPRATREVARGASSLSTAFSQAPEGVLRFNVDVSVDMKEFATWKPERIAAFWAGIAQVLSAKAAVEGEAGR